MIKKLSIVLLFVLVFSCKDETKRILSDVIENQKIVVDGSTSAYPLQVQLLSDLAGYNTQWIYTDEQEEQRGLFPTKKADHDPVYDWITSIKHNGTNGAIVNVINGVSDVALVARSMSVDEMTLCKEKGIELEGHICAMDAFVFLANTSNTLQNVKTQDLILVYSGKITDWSSLGGKAGKISAYQRERNSGSQELMQDLIMKSIKPIEAPNMIILGMKGPFHMIGGDKATGFGGDSLGLGYTVYYYAINMFPHDYVKMLSVDGVYPDSKSISNRTYPHTAPVYVYIRKSEAKDSPARLYRDWILSHEGQKSVQKSGYVKAR